MSIVENRKAFHDYFIEERVEAGLALTGWEVKAIRAGRAHLKEAYVVIKNGELVLIGAHITPLTTASTHVNADPTRTRKLLMHREEINRLVGKVERAGYTLAPLDLHYKNGRVKIEVGLAKGKKQHDKRDTIKDREWAREQQRLLRNRPGSGRACSAAADAWARRCAASSPRFAPDIGQHGLRRIDPAAHGGLQRRRIIAIHVVAGEIDTVDQPGIRGARASGRAGVGGALLGNDLKPHARGPLGLQPSQLGIDVQASMP